MQHCHTIFDLAMYQQISIHYYAFIYVFRIYVIVYKKKKNTNIDNDKNRKYLFFKNNVSLRFQTKHKKQILKITLILFNVMSRRDSIIAIKIYSIKSGKLNKISCALKNIH